MEMIELILTSLLSGALEFGCLFDVITAVVDFFAIRSAYGLKKDKLKELDPKARRRRGYSFAILLFFALSMTGLLVYKWASALRPQ
jgi:hypothetical protein